MEGRTDEQINKDRAVLNDGLLPPEVRRGEYRRLGVFLLQYFALVNIYEKYCIIIALL